MSIITHQIDSTKRARLRWRARRGLLENDLILTRFLDAHEVSMTDDEVEAFAQLMALSENDLIDLLLVRKQPEGLLDLPQVHALLTKINSS